MYVDKRLNSVMLLSLTHAAHKVNQTFIYKNRTLRRVKSKKQHFNSTELFNWGPIPTTGSFSCKFTIVNLFQAAVLYTSPQTEKFFSPQPLSRWILSTTNPFTVVFQVLFFKSPPLNIPSVALGKRWMLACPSQWNMQKIFNMTGY